MLLLLLYARVRRVLVPAIDAQSCSAVPLRPISALVLLPPLLIFYNRHDLCQICTPSTISHSQVRRPAIRIRPSSSAAYQYTPQPPTSLGYPLKILLHSMDEYTETSVLALSCLMHVECPALIAAVCFQTCASLLGF
jgi:hypothetical protein